MTPRTDPHVAELEQRIAETREALGRTVEELAAKVDVPSRAKAKARDTADRLRAAEDRTRTKATQAAAGFKSRLPGGAASADPGAAFPAGSGAHRVDVASRGVRSYVPAAAAATVSAAALAALGWLHRPGAQ